MHILSSDFFKEFAHIDDDDELNTVKLVCEAAEATLEGSTGKTFDNNDYLAVLYCQILAKHWYDHREYMDDKTIGQKVSFTLQTIRNQLKYGKHGVKNET